MNIITLGTSSGVPTKQRNLSAVAVWREGRKPWVLVDCGEATQHQLQHVSLSLQQLSAIAITHVHGDHCYGLPGLVASAQMAGREQPLKIICPKPVETMLRTVIDCTDMFLRYPIEYIDVATLEGSVDVGDFSLSAIELSHRVPSFAYQLEENQVELRLNAQALEAAGVPKGPLWGRLRKEGCITLEDGREISGERFIAPSRAPRKVIVAGDNDQPQLLAEACAKSQLLIHEATYTQAVLDAVGPAPQHSSAKMVADMAEQSGLPNLILTHFSARFQYDESAPFSMQQVAQEAKACYGGELFLANDLDHFRLSSEGKLSRLSEFRFF